MGDQRDAPDTVKSLSLDNRGYNRLEKNLDGRGGNGIKGDGDDLK